MINGNKHIVSTIKWDLGFDQKDEATKLQAQLSSWSKVELLREMNTVFESLCPKGQTWSIEALTLDLGPVDYVDLKNNLLRKFKATLTNKLLELAYYTTNEQGGIEVLEHDMSQIKLLERYLELGYMPWNQTGAVSVNALFEELYAQNKEALLIMLRIKGRSRTIRRRIAWQFQEPAIRKLVRELEPNNHVQLFEFTDELVKIREKEAFVQSSAVAFRKNVWFWVLNHLFTERGTLFNRLEFMDSSIRQMAQHYNMDYDELFAEIELAVDKLGGKSTVRPDFIKALELLSERRLKKTKDTYLFSDNQESIVIQLKYLLSIYSGRDGVSFNQNPDELIEGIYRNNPIILRDYLLKVGYQTHRWFAITKKLNKESIVILLKVLARNNFSTVFQALSLLNQVKTKKQQATKNHFREVHALTYLIKNNATSFSTTSYLDTVLKSTISENNYSAFYHQLFTLGQSQFLSMGIDPELFSLTVDRLYKLMIDNGDQVNSDFMLKCALDHLFRNANSEQGIFKMTDPTALRIVAYWVKSKPRKVLDLLTVLKRSPLFKERLVHIFDNVQTKVLLREIEGKKSRIVVTLYRFIAEGALVSGMAGAVKAKYTLKLGLLTLLDNPDIQEDELMIRLIAEFLEKTGEQTDKFISKLLQQPAFRDLEYSERLEQALQERLKHYSSKEWEHQYTPELAAKWLKAQLEKYKNFAVNLAQNERLVMFEAIIPKKGGELQRELENHIRRIGDKVMSHHLVQAKAYGLILELLADYQVHKGDMNILLRHWKKSFEVHVQANTSSEKLRSTEGVKHNRKKWERKLEIIENYLFSSKDKPVDSRLFQQTFEDVIFNSFHVFREKIKFRITTPEVLRKIDDVVPLSLFVEAIFNRGLQSHSAIRSTFTFLIQLHTRFSVSSIRDHWKIRLWQLALKLVDAPGQAAKELETEMRDLVTELIFEKSISVNELFLMAKEQAKQLPNFIKTCLKDMNENIGAAFHEAPVVATDKKESSTETIQRSDVEVIALQLLEQGRGSIDFDYQQSKEVLLKQLLKSDPVLIHKVLKRTRLNDSVIYDLLEQIDFGDWTTAIAAIYPDKSTDMERLTELFYVLKEANFEGVSGQDLQYILFSKLIKAWKKNNWRIVDPRFLWSELNWDLHVKYGVSNKIIVKELTRLKEIVPMAYRFSLMAFVASKQPQKRRAEQTMPLPVKESDSTDQSYFEKERLASGIAVTNAGIVIVNSYIRTLFDRLQLLEGSEFKSEEAKQKGVHYLQYIVNGLTVNEEQHLVLNKVLCGIYPTTPIISEIEITKDEKALIDGMIDAIINYWPAIGKCSVNGFRGNWIIRDGMLTEDEERWNLTVEKRAYDILLHQSPFSFSIIKHPWMDKPIHVNWAY